MEIVKSVLLILLGILFTPIISILILSFKETDGQKFKWYNEIINNDTFLSAFTYSFSTSIVVAVLNTIICFLISISYFNKKIAIWVILVVLLLGLTPPDIISVSINKMAQNIGFNRSNVLFLYFGLLLYCFPFGIIILWSRYYFIEIGIITVSEDLGLKNSSIILKIILPLSSPLSPSTTFVKIFLIGPTEIRTRDP